MNLEIIKFVNCIIFAVLSVLLIYEMRDDDSNVKLSSIRWIIVVMSSIVFLLIANYAVPLYLKLPFVIITFIIVCQLMFKVSFIKKMFACIVAVSIAWLIDSIISFFFIFILKFNMQDLNKDLQYYVFYNTLSIMLFILAIIFLKTRRLIFHVNKNMSILTRNLLFFIVVFQILNVFVQFFLIINLSYNSNLNIISFISYICSIASIGILLYSTNIIIDKENIIKLSNEYNENLSVYNGVLQSSIESQRKIAHEHGNQLSVLSGYIASANLEKAKSYLEKIIGNCNSENELLSHIKESGLKALLVFKIAMIERKNIDFELVVDEDIENTIIPSEDLCQIVGIFLDNAIDAAVQSEEPYITMSILKNEKDLAIIIMNSTNNEDIDTEKIYQKGYSSKGEGRGFGLHIVDEIVKKYKELNLQTRVEDGLFIQELRVADKSTSSTAI